MHDLVKLKNECPEPRILQTLDNSNILSLYDYHPWHDTANIDFVTHTLLNLKKNNESDKRARLHSINFLTKALRKSLIPVINLENIACAVVPKSTKDEVSTGMLHLLFVLQDEIGFKNSVNPLDRITTIPKAATGGPRSTKLHKKTIIVNDKKIVDNMNVLLFDDVTTTGRSLVACKELLIEAGANQVFMIAIGQSV
jgi:phosphoribosylpyrophosphate synthetase